MGSFCGSLPLLYPKRQGLSKWAEMPPLCQPRGTGADVRLCVYIFFFGYTLGGLLGTDGTIQTNQTSFDFFVACHIKYHHNVFSLNQGISQTL